MAQRPHPNLTSLATFGPGSLGSRHVDTGFNVATASTSGRLPHIPSLPRARLAALSLIAAQLAPTLSRRELEIIKNGWADLRERSAGASLTPKQMRELVAAQPWRLGSSFVNTMQYNGNRMERDLSQGRGQREYAPYGGHARSQVILTEEQGKQAGLVAGAIKDLDRKYKADLAQARQQLQRHRQELDRSNDRLMQDIRSGRRPRSEASGYQRAILLAKDQYQAAVATAKKERDQRVARIQKDYPDLLSALATAEVRQPDVQAVGTGAAAAGQLKAVLPLALAHGLWRPARTPEQTGSREDYKTVSSRAAVGQASGELQGVDVRTFLAPYVQMLTQYVSMLEGVVQRGEGATRNAARDYEAAKKHPSRPGVNLAGLETLIAHEMETLYRNTERLTRAKEARNRLEGLAQQKAFVPLELFHELDSLPDSLVSEGQSADVLSHALQTLGRERQSSTLGPDGRALFERHSAEDLARERARIAIVERYLQLNPSGRSLETDLRKSGYLQAPADRESKDWTFKAGKFVGFRISEVPIEYVAWLAGGGIVTVSYLTQELKVRGGVLKLPGKYRRMFIKEPFIHPVTGAPSQMIARCRQYLHSQQGRSRMIQAYERAAREGYEDEIKVLIGQVPELEEMSRKVREGKEAGGRVGQAQAQEQQGRLKWLRQRLAYRHVYRRAYQEELRKARTEERTAAKAQLRAEKKGQQAYEAELEKAGLSEFQYHYGRFLSQGQSPEEAERAAKEFLKRGRDFATPSGFRDSELTKEERKALRKEEDQGLLVRQREYLAFLRQVRLAHGQQSADIPRSVKEFERWQHEQRLEAAARFDRLRAAGRLPAWAASRRPQELSDFDIWRLGKLWKQGTEHLLPLHAMADPGPIVRDAGEMWGDPEAGGFTNLQMSKIDPNWKPSQPLAYAEGTGGAIRFDQFAERIHSARSRQQLAQVVAEIRRIFQDRIAPLDTEAGLARQQELGLTPEEYMGGSYHPAIQYLLNLAQRQHNRLANKDLIPLPRTKQAAAREKEQEDQDQEDFAHWLVAEDAGLGFAGMEDLEAEYSSMGTGSELEDQLSTRRRVQMRGEYESPEDQQARQEQNLPYPALGTEEGSPGVEPRPGPDRAVQGEIPGRSYWDSEGMGTSEIEDAEQEAVRAQRAQQEQEALDSWQTSYPSTAPGSSYPDDPAQYEGPGRRLAKGLPPD